MNGIIAKTLTAMVMGGGLAAAGGCYTYHDLVDPCYPKRYAFAAEQEVYQAFDPQVANGHILDQTVWNDHFEPGTDRLTPGGLEHLAYLARRRPAPDPVIYLQVAQDLPYDPAAPAEFVKARSKLDTRRIEAIEKYLSAETAGRPVAFEVRIHDPAVVGMSAIPANISIQQMYTGYRGNLPITAGAGSVNTAGGAGATGGATGGSGR
jgi:hypothetical protein